MSPFISLSLYNIYKNLSLLFCRRFGFTKFVSDLFDAPEPVMRYLFDSYHLYNIPIADAASSDQVTQVCLCRFFFDIVMIIVN